MFADKLIMNSYVDLHNIDKYTITPKDVKINNKLCIIVKNMYMLLRQLRA